MDNNMTHLVISRFNEEEIELAWSLSDLQYSTFRVDEIPINSTYQESLCTEDDPTALRYIHKRTSDEYQDDIGIAYDSGYERKVSRNLHKNHRKTKSLDNVLTCCIEPTYEFLYGTVIDTEAPTDDLNIEMSVETCDSDKLHAKNLDYNKIRSNLMHDDNTTNLFHILFNSDVDQSIIIK